MKTFVLIAVVIAGAIICAISEGLRDHSESELKKTYELSKQIRTLDAIVQLQEISINTACVLTSLVAKVKMLEDEVLEMRVSGFIIQPIQEFNTNIIMPIPYPRDGLLNYVITNNLLIE